ncbi:MAG: signal recognition particle-docking protein FtsY [Dehalococcoidia bacterium]|nr:signal recognition particle-docking protein FtsY [Dehalococcoidia bacterium]
MFNLFKKTEQALKRTRDGWFGKVTKLFERQTISDDLWDELEELLISADVGVSTADKLIQRVRERARAEKLGDSGQVRTALKQEMVNILNTAKPPVASEGMQVILVVGVNGSGKTTSIAKLASLYRSQNMSVVLAAGDTFRAAAIEQLQLWGGRIGVDVIANKPGGDPAAVVYDALQAAASRHADVVIVDTAGRLHTKFNLMEELKKIKRVAAKSTPAWIETVLVLDATTGQNGLAQAKSFSEAVEVTGVLLTKLDGTAKGGIVLAICDQLNLPILYIGTGESVDDITPFDAVSFVDALFGGEQDRPQGGQGGMQET